MSQSSQDESNGIRLEGWIAGVGALQREMLEFVAHRLEKDSEAIRGAIGQRDRTPVASLLRDASSSLVLLDPEAGLS